MAMQMTQAPAVPMEVGLPAAEAASGMTPVMLAVLSGQLDTAVANQQADAQKRARAHK